MDRRWFLRALMGGVVAATGLPEAWQTLQRLTAPSLPYVVGFRLTDAELWCMSSDYVELVVTPLAKKLADDIDRQILEDLLKEPWADAARASNSA